MIFRNLESQRVVFVEAKTIQPKEETKKPFTILKFADPITYDSIELFKSRNLVRDMPEPGTKVNLVIGVNNNGRYTNVVVEDIIEINK
jgi:hypothetical protein